MPALKSLTDDHHAILELLGALQTYATRLRGGASVDPLDLSRFADTFRSLLDYRHQEKEEAILLPLLARNGFGWSTGLLAELREEHAHIRYLMAVLCQAAGKAVGEDPPGSAEAPGSARAGLGSPEERRQVAEAALAFVERQRRHMQKEEHLLLPLVRERLGERALAQLDAELRQFDAMSGRSAATELALSCAAALVQRYSEHSATVDVSGLSWQPSATDGALLGPATASERAR